MMNDNYVESRIHATGTTTTGSFLEKLLPFNDGLLVNTLFMDVLSRMPTSDELTTSMAELESGGPALRTQKAEDLLWTLFNKLDFCSTTNRRTQQ